MARSQSIHVKAPPREHTNLVDIVIDEIALILCDVQNSITESSVDEQGFPSSDGVGSNHGMFSGKIIAFVQRVSTLDIVSNFDAQFLGLCVEELSIVSTFEGLEV